MKLYRFSPIQSQAELMQAIEYLHTTCHRLCYERFGEYLPVAGNIGVFCRYQEEFGYLTKLREELTETAGNYKDKYFKLKQPIHIAEKDGIPAATYDYLYIRRVDPYRSQVGDVDFVLDTQRHKEMAATLNTDDFTDNLRMFGRPEENMFELWNPDYDVMTYIVDIPMNRRIEEGRG